MREMKMNKIMYFILFSFFPNINFFFLSPKHENIKIFLPSFLFANHQKGFNIKTKITIKKTSKHNCIEKSKCCKFSTLTVEKWNAL